MHRILRPLLIVLTLSMLTVALFQSAGRLAFLVLDDLEPKANQWLAGLQVELTGLEGRWRFLNPVVLIDRVDLASGYLADVVVELDWVESLLRNRMVARRLYVGSADLTFAKMTSGRWRIAGSTREPPNFDFQSLLFESDEVRFDGRVAFQIEGEPSASQSVPVEVNYRAINRGEIHRHRLSLHNTGESCEAPCEGFLEFQTNESFWPTGDAKTLLSVNAENLELPRHLNGLTAIRLKALGLDWQSAGESAGGHIEANLDSFELPGNHPLSASVGIKVRGGKGIYEGLVDRFDLRSGEASLSLPGLRLVVGDGLSEIWTEHVDLAQVAGFLQTALAGIEPAKRWLDALNISADAFNVHGYVRPATMEFGYAATLSGVNTDAYRGVPTVRGGAGELIGYARGAQLNIKADAIALQFPGTFRESWRMRDVQGSVRGWFDEKYLGLQGSNFRITTGDSRVVGGFSLTRPREVYEQQLTLLINVDEMSVEQAKRFVPFKLSDGLRSWLESGPRQGQLHDARFAYHGQIRTRPGELSRRLELQVRISDGQVIYHEDWPEVHALNGMVHVAGRNIRVAVESGSSGAAILDGSRVALGQNAAYADVNLKARVATDDALEFVRTSPLANWLTFVVPAWSGAGELTLDGDLHVPLKPFQTEAADDAVAIDLAIGLLAAGLDMPDYRINLAGLNGTTSYTYPHYVHAESITGTLFDEPVSINVDADVESISFHIDGRARDSDVLRMIDLDDPGFFQGGFDYLATLRIAMTDEDVTRLDVSSDLEGLELMLPVAYAKPISEKRQISMSLQFLEKYNSVRFQHGDITGWVHVDDFPLRGAIGFATDPPMVDASAQSISLAGYIENFALEEVLPDEQSISLEVPLQLMNLEVGRIDIGEFEVHKAVLSGIVDKDLLDLEIDSEMLAGTITQSGDSPINVDLARLNFPDSDAFDEGSDPLDPAVMEDLREADVVIASLRVGDENYGSWQFQIRPRYLDGGGLKSVAFENLSADIRGTVIHAPIGAVWLRADNTSRFIGDILAGNLSNVLPLWDYAPSLETTSVLMSADFTWAGSPPNIELERLIGNAEIHAKNGRFLDVESGQGAQRIFSFVNFGAITKRLGGDFSDVTGKGVNFDTLDAKVRLTEGKLKFVEPMQVLSTGSDFRITGTVDLVEGVLDNEMIVTLPLSKNLPWYAVLVGLSNPLGGLAVIVGEKIMRRPLEQLSSARYSISGTLDDPQVELVNILPSMNIPEAVDGTISTEDPSAPREPDSINSGDLSEPERNDARAPSVAEKTIT